MSGVGVSEHHHGEILQGAVRRDGEVVPCLITMPTRRLGSRARYVSMADESDRGRDARSGWTALDTSGTDAGQDDENAGASKGPVLEVVPAWKSKAARAARLALEFVGAPVGGRLEIECSVAT